MEIDANRTEKEAFVMLEQLGKQAKEASVILGKAGIEDKNEVLKRSSQMSGTESGIYLK